MQLAESGAEIEGASGMSYPGYMREHVFTPAEMRHSDVDDLAGIIPHRARGYSPRVYGKFDGEVSNAELMDPSYKLPGGGLLSTAGDLARFALAVQSGVLVSRAAFARMSSSQKTRAGHETGYGYGWHIDHRAQQAPAAGPRELLGHVMVSERIWLERIAGEQNTQATFPVLPREELLHGHEENREALEKLVAARLEDVIHFRRGSGEEYDARVVDIIHHLVTHGYHHRGQLAAHYARKGLSYPDTDHIRFLMESGL